MTLYLQQAISLPRTPLTATSEPRQQQLTIENRIQERIISTRNPSERLRDFRIWLTKLYENNVGLLLIALSQLFMTFMNIAVKFLNGLDNPVPTLELVFVRMIVTYGFALSFMCVWIVQKIPHAFFGPPEVRMLLIFRGVSGFFGLFGIYYSLKYLSLSDAVVLTFLSPTTTAIAGYLFLHETLSRREIFAGLLSLAGVVLIARPQSLFGARVGEVTINDPDTGTGMIDVATSKERLIAVGVAMLGVLGATGAYVSLRAIGTRAHTMHSLTFFSSYCVIVSSIGMIIMDISPVIPTRWAWCGLLIAVGVCGFIAQVLLVMGLQRETASRGTLALYVQIIFAAVLERVIFKTTPSYLSVLGTLIIMGSAVYIVVNKNTKLDGYKRIPQNFEDIESHELGSAGPAHTPNPNIDETDTNTAVAVPPPVPDSPTTPSS